MLRIEGDLEVPFAQAALQTKVVGDRAAGTVNNRVLVFSTVAYEPIETMIQFSMKLMELPFWAD